MLLRIFISPPSQSLIRRKMRRKVWGNSSNPAVEMGW